AAHAQTLTPQQQQQMALAASASPTPTPTSTTSTSSQQQQAAMISPTPAPVSTAPSCARTVKADVVALDQVITFNRLGAMNPGGMMFALRNYVKAIDPASGIVAGNVTLKEYKRPRPLVLRMNVGDCI